MASGDASSTGLKVRISTARALQYCNRHDWLRLISVIAALIALAGIGPAAADVTLAARVVFVKGVVSAQRGSETPRMLGAGNQLFEGDLVTTGRKGFAVIEFTDGGRMTLRPGTLFRVVRYSDTPNGESLALELFRGGLRALTGLIAKRNPDAYRITTATATVGVRGTDFDARICERDCAEENQGIEAAGAAAPEVVARVVQANGPISASAATGQARSLAEGSPLYEGDTLRTAAGATVTAAFRDGSRVALQGNSAFAIERFAFQSSSGRPDSVLLRLVRGGARVLTGLVAERNPQAMQLAAANAVIGIRGTGVDVICDERCAAPSEPRRAGDGLYVHAWQGSIEVRVGAAVLVVNLDQAAFLAADASQAVLLAELPPFMRNMPVTRPDRINVDLRELFGTQVRDPAPPGLYVLVRDGHVAITRGGRVLDLGAGESGFADPAASEAVRLEAPPVFLRQDPYPRPDQLTPEILRIIELVTEPRTGGGAAEQECEVR